MGKEQGPQEMPPKVNQLPKKPNEWTLGRDLRHMDNISKFTGLYKGERRVHGIGNIPSQNGKSRG